MKKTATIGALAGVAMLLGVGTAAVAAPDPETEDVKVNVAIEPRAVDGALAMTVASDATTLTETTSNDLTKRTFEGRLPVVTVTDTRSQDAVPADAGWAVTAQATAFMGDAGQQPIGPEHLAWVPKLIKESETGLVMEGPAAEGMSTQERTLLAMTANAHDINPEGQWTADAGLTLSTDATVAPGKYSSTITLSLFE